jgi:hypothetical protein
MEYTKFVVKGVWPALLSDPYLAYYYAKEIIKGRWPEGEKTIASSPNDAWIYAMDVVKGRWPEAEPGISKEPHAAYNYARYVIKGRWPEGEKAIATDPEYAERYKNFLSSMKKDVSEGGGVGVVKGGKDSRYNTATMGNQNAVNGNTLGQEMKAFGLVGRKNPGATRTQKPVNKNVGQGVYEQRQQDLEKMLKNYFR